jgi:hypothetical protein
MAGFLALGRAGQILVGGLGLTASIAVVVGILAPWLSQTMIALVLLGLTCIAMLIVLGFPALRRPVGRAFGAASSRLVGEADSAGVERSGLDVLVKVTRPAISAELQFVSTSGATEPRGWYELQWRLQFSTRRDLTGAYVALYHSVEESLKA